MIAGPHSVTMAGAVAWRDVTTTAAAPGKHRFCVFIQQLRAVQHHVGAHNIEFALRVRGGGAASPPAARRAAGGWGGLAAWAAHAAQAFQAASSSAWRSPSRPSPHGRKCCCWMITPFGALDARFRGSAGARCGRIRPTGHHNHPSSTHYQENPSELADRLGGDEFGLAVWLEVVRPVRSLYQLPGRPNCVPRVLHRPFGCWWVSMRLGVRVGPLRFPWPPRTVAVATYIAAASAGLVRGQMRRHCSHRQPEDAGRWPLGQMPGEHSAFLGAILSGCGAASSRRQFGRQSAPRLSCWLQLILVEATRSLRTGPASVRCACNAVCVGVCAAFTPGPSRLSFVIVTRWLARAQAA